MHQRGLKQGDQPARDELHDIHREGSSDRVKAGDLVPRAVHINRFPVLFCQK